jgi:hypothetical protein
MTIFFPVSSALFYILWHIDHKTNNGTMAIARQQLCKYTTVLELLLGSGPRATIELLFVVVFLWLHSEATSLEQPCWVSAVQWSGAS